MFRVQANFFRSALRWTRTISVISDIKRVPLSWNRGLFAIHAKYMSHKSNICTDIAKSNGSSSFTDVPGVKSGGETYVMAFTCTKCDTRSVKKISKQSYHNGVVIVRCPGCQNKHLIADNLGIFEDKGWDIEKFLSQNGAMVKRISDEEGLLELSAEDILGNKGIN